MNTIVSLLLLASGLALLVGTLLSRVPAGQSFPRFGAPAARSHRVWLLIMGLALSIGGLAGMFFAPSS